MKTKITRKDLENPQRFIGEGLGAPEVGIKPKDDGSNFKNPSRKTKQSLHC